MRFRAQTIDEDVPWLGHERDDVVLKRDGSVFVLFELEGVRFETLEDWLIAERQQVSTTPSARSRTRRLRSPSGSTEAPPLQTSIPTSPPIDRSARR